MAPNAGQAQTRVPWEGKGRKDGEDWWATKGAAKDHGGGWTGKGEDVEIAGWEDVSGRR